MKELKLYQLNKDQFEPFGDIIDTKQQLPFEINNGNCFRYNNLAKLSFNKGQAGISLFKSKKITLPIVLILWKNILWAVRHLFLFLVADS